MIKVVLDVMGGDNAPVELIKGGVLSVNKNKDLHIIMVGKQDIINSQLLNYEYNKEQISIIDAQDEITNDDVPTSAIRQKTESSLVKTINELRTNEEVVGMVSAGSTGAVLTGAFLKLGRLKGVSRPALCPILPTVNGGIVSIIDCGANIDSKPINLVHFALMANAYLKNVYKIENPRVALLNVGTEDHKGNELCKQVFPMLKELKDINFVGNMEARDLLSGNYDIVVTDAFAGNVLLKSTEGAILGLLKMLKKEIKSSFSSKIGYLFMKKSFKNLKKTIDYNEKGGAVLLGCKKLVVKSHGSSKATSIAESINQVVEMHLANVTSAISSAVENVDLEVEND